MDEATRKKAYELLARKNENGQKSLGWSTSKFSPQRDRAGSSLLREERQSGGSNEYSIALLSEQSSIMSLDMIIDKARRRAIDDGKAFDEADFIMNLVQERRKQAIRSNLVDKPVNSASTNRNDESDSEDDRNLKLKTKTITLPSESVKSVLIPAPTNSIPNGKVQPTVYRVTKSGKVSDEDSEEDESGISHKKLSKRNVSTSFRASSPEQPLKADIPPSAFIQDKKIFNTPDRHEIGLHLARTGTTPGKHKASNRDADREDELALLASKLAGVDLSANSIASVSSGSSRGTTLDQDVSSQLSVAMNSGMNGSNGNLRDLVKSKRKEHDEETKEKMAAVAAIKTRSMQSSEDRAKALLMAIHQKEVTQAPTSTPASPMSANNDKQTGPGRKLKPKKTNDDFPAAVAITSGTVMNPTDSTDSNAPSPDAAAAPSYSTAVDMDAARLQWEKSAAMERARELIAKWNSKESPLMPPAPPTRADNNAILNEARAVVAKERGSEKSSEQQHPQYAKSYHTAVLEEARAVIDKSNTKIETPVIVKEASNKSSSASLSNPSDKNQALMDLVKAKRKEYVTSKIPAPTPSSPPKKQHTMMSASSVSSPSAASHNRAPPHSSPDVLPSSLSSNKNKDTNKDKKKSPVQIEDDEEDSDDDERSKSKSSSKLKGKHKEKESSYDREKGSRKELKGGADTGGMDVEVHERHHDSSSHKKKNKKWKKQGTEIDDSMKSKNSLEIESINGDNKTSTSKEERLVAGELKLIGKKSIAKVNKVSQKDSDSEKETKRASNLTNEQRLEAYVKRQQQRRTLLQTQLSAIGCTGETIAECNNNIRSSAPDLFSCAPNAVRQGHIIESVKSISTCGDKHDKKPTKTLRSQHMGDGTSDDSDDSGESQSNASSASETEDSEDSEDTEEGNESSSAEEEEGDHMTRKPEKGSSNIVEKGIALARIISSRKAERHPAELPVRSQPSGWGSLLACVQPQSTPSKPITFGADGREEGVEDEEEDEDADTEEDDSDGLSGEESDSGSESSDSEEGRTTNKKSRRIPGSTGVINKKI